MVSMLDSRLGCPDFSPCWEHCVEDYNNSTRCMNVRAWGIDVCKSDIFCKYPCSLSTSKPVHVPCTKPHISNITIHKP